MTVLKYDSATGYWAACQAPHPDMPDWCQHADCLHVAQKSLRSRQLVNYPHSTQTPPDHYAGEGMQVWDVIKAFGLDYFRGNVVKYVLRAGRKHDTVQDLMKARDYIDKLIEMEREREEPADR